MHRVLRPPGVAAVLAHQNYNLRQAISLEFKALSAAGAHPRYYDAMQAYHHTLIEALDTNDTTLQTLFGTPEQGSLAQRIKDDVMLTFGAHDVYDGLGSVWRHMAKDWTAEGESAQAELRRRICDIVSIECARPRATSDDSGAGVDASSRRVVIPGCGQGRLAYDIACALPDDVSVLGIEQSPAQLTIAHHFLPPAAADAPAADEPPPPPAALPFHPWLDAFTNNRHTTSRAAKLVARRPTTTAAGAPSRPHVPPSLAIRQGDFTALDAPSSPSSPHEKPPPLHDVCVTSFFLDCLDDVADGVRCVHQALRPGGLWVFAGPLHFGQGGGGGAPEPRPSPTLEQFLTLVHEAGFAVEVQEGGRSAPGEAGEAASGGAHGRHEPKLLHEAVPPLPPGVEMVHAPYVARPGAFLLEADWTVPVFAARRM